MRVSRRLASVASITGKYGRMDIFLIRVAVSQKLFADSVGMRVI